MNTRITSGAIILILTVAAASLGGVKELWGANLLGFFPDIVTFFVVLLAVGLLALDLRGGGASPSYLSFSTSRRQ